MSPTGAVITPDALSMGLRQCQSESTISVTVGLSGVQTRSGGDLVDRHRTFPGGWGVNRDKGYRRGRDGLGNCEAVGVRAHTFGRCRPVVDRPNRVNLRDTRAAPTYSTPAHASLGRSRVPILQLAVVITPKTRMQRSRRDESDGDDRFAAPKLPGPQGCLPNPTNDFS